MVILGVDYGTKKIGLAFLDTDTEVITPLIAIPVTKQTIAELSKIISSYKIEGIVFGMPSSEKMNKKIYDFAHELKQIHDIPMDFSNEDLSSKQAKSVLSSLKETHNLRINKFGQKDQVSATIILEEWFNSRK